MVKTAVDLFTIGYQGKKLVDLIKILKERNVNIVADIRANPYSRNKDYSQKYLIAALNAEGIQYLHFKTLGRPIELRQEVAESGDYNRFFKQYEDYLSSQSATLNLLGNLVIDNTLCLLCMESDSNICHRRTVADKIALMLNNKYQVIISHL
jgi:uncharacterized protein (DUF488 family)